MTRISVSPSPSSTTRSAACTRRSPTSRSCVTKSRAAPPATRSNGCDGRRARSAVGHPGTRTSRGDRVGGASLLALPQNFVGTDGGSLRDQFTLEHLVGGGAGQVGGDADVSRPGLGGQVGLGVQERFEGIGGQRVAVAQ